MRVTPKTEQEITEENLLPDGIYDFQILSAEDYVSQNSGKEMIKLAVRVYNEHGDAHCVIYDYLMDAVAYKLRHCAEVCELLKEYESGYIPPEKMVNKCGRVKIYTQKDKNGQYPDKNAIRDYIKPVTIEPVNQAQVFQRQVAESRKRSIPVGADLDDDAIPF